MSASPSPPNTLGYASAAQFLRGPIMQVDGGTGSNPAKMVILM